MERKLIVQGKQAFTIALPIDWIRKHNLQPKDPIQITEDSNILHISATKQAPTTSTTLDVTDNDRLEAMLKIESKYYQGYDEIIIKHNNLPLIREIAQTLLGIVIEDYKKNSCTLKSIVQTPEDNIYQLVKKTLFLLREQSKSLIALSQGKISLETARAEGDLLDYSNMYAIRFLNKYEQNATGNALTMICTSFDMVSDIMGEIATHIGKNEKVAKEVDYYVKQYVNLILKNDFSTLNKILLDESKREKKIFLDGLLHALIENMYNFSAYIVEMFNNIKK